MYQHRCVGSAKPISNKQQKNSPWQMVSFSPGEKPSHSNQWLNEHSPSPSKEARRSLSTRLNVAGASRAQQTYLSIQPLSTTLSVGGNRPPLGEDTHTHALHTLCITVRTRALQRNDGKERLAWAKALPGQQPPWLLGRGTGARTQEWAGLFLPYFQPPSSSTSAATHTRTHAHTQHTHTHTLPHASLQK